MRRCEAAGSVFIIPIADIEIDTKSRDDIPAILLALQHIYSHRARYEEVLTLLKTHVAQDCDHNNGRPGMTLWRLLVLATVKQGLDCDYARLQELANQHLALRQMLQHPADDKHRYEERTLQNNIDLLTPEVLKKVSDIVAEEGLALAGKSPGAGYVGRVDSFVVKSNVHHPTDLNLLWDATRTLLRDGGRLATAHDVPGWRQWQYWLREGKKLYNRISRPRLWQARPKEVEAFLQWSTMLSERLTESLPLLLAADVPAKALAPLETWVKDAERFRDQLRRRILDGETIPHAEKLFSIFERYTRWIMKGKAGSPVELGVPLSILEESSGFILAWRLHWKGGDVDAAVPLVTEAQQRYPGLEQCSFDRGYHSPANQKALRQLLKRVVLPVKGRGNRESQAREAEEEFVAARRQHPAVESAIHALGCHGLQRVRNRGPERFERTVAISILATNLHRLGRLLQATSAKTPRKRLKQAA